MSDAKWDLEQELIEAQMILDEFVGKFKVMVESEGRDVINAIELAVIEGPDARDKLTDTSGNPLPEMVAFDLAVIARGLLREWLKSLIGGALTGDDK